LAAALQKDTSVFCPDIVGRGKSDYLGDPSLYSYPQYVADMTGMIARIGSDFIDWVGTSMGGIIGMLLAASANSPIRRLVINDVGPFIPLAALKRIGDYAGLAVEFADKAQLERHMRANYASFGITRDEDWRHLVQYGARVLPNGKLAFAYDAAIAENFRALKQDVDMWDIYDRIKCPTLLIRGTASDVLSAPVAGEMTRRGPKAHLIEFNGVGHAPALMDAAQIAAVQNFLRP
jgi:pimeloyl-ACP methyl ester carboxylesterase